MGLAADACIAGGGRVIGIIPSFLQQREVDHPGLDELIVVGTMHERKQRMAELADAFVILPGGMGTLDEMFEILTWKQLGLHAKPIILVDAGGYWRLLVALLDHLITKNFVRPDMRALWEVVPDAASALALLAAKPVAIGKVRTDLG
jgi:hypothetical protein